MSGGLDPFRQRLDRLDEDIARSLGERFEICREIARYKRVHDIPMMQPARVVEVRARYLARGKEVDLPADFTANLFDLLIAATCKMEDELIASDETLPSAHRNEAGRGLAVARGDVAAARGDAAEATSR